MLVIFVTLVKLYLALNVVDCRNSLKICYMFNKFGFLGARANSGRLEVVSRELGLVRVGLPAASPFLDVRGAVAVFFVKGLGLNLSIL